MDCYFCNFYVRLPSKWTRSCEFCIVLYREILTSWKLNRCLELAQYYSSLGSIICWKLDWWRNLNRVSLCILKPYKNFICWLIKNEYCKGKEPPGGGSFLVYLSFCLTSGVELGLTSCEVEFAIAEMACVSRNVRRTFHVPFLLFQILRTVKDFPTFHFWARCLTSGVELGLTGLTSTSWYVRTTRSESLAAYQSSVSVLSVRPRILVRKVFYFYSQILIGCLGILGLLRRRMVVVSHLFRHRRC